MATIAPSDIGATSTGNSSVDQAIFSAAAKYGVPPEVLFADAQVESGLDPNRVGDQGTSFGLFKEHEGGELTTVANATNPQYAADLAAQTFKAAQQQNPNMTWGQIAAAAQRPADQAGYAVKVNSELGAAGNMPSNQAAQSLGANVSPNLLKAGGSSVPVVGGGGGGNSFETATEQAGQNPQYNSQLAYYLAGQAAPGIAGAQLQEAQALSSAGLSAAQIQVGAQGLALNTGYGLAQDVGNIQGNKLQQQALASQIGTAAQQQGTELKQYQTQLEQYGVTGQSLASQSGYIGQQQDIASQEYGVTQQSLASQGGYIGQESDLAGQELGNQQAQLANQSSQIAYEYPLQMQQQQGAAAAAGATNTVGNREALANITATNGAGGFAQTGLALQGQAAGLAYTGTEQGLEQQQAQLGYSGQQAALQEQGTQAGLTQQQAQIGFSQQQNNISQQLAQLGQTSELQGYQGQQAQYANAQQQLKLAAQQAGIPVQQAVSQLSLGLQTLGINANPTQFIAQAAAAQGTEAQDYAAALSAAAVSTGLGASSFTGK